MSGGNWRETGDMPDPATVSPDDINTATGRPHRDDAQCDAWLAKTGRQ